MANHWNTDLLAIMMVIWEKKINKLQNEVWKEFKPICHIKVINLRKSCLKFNLTYPKCLNWVIHGGNYPLKKKQNYGKKKENLEKHLIPKSSEFNSIFIILLRSNSLGKLQLAFVIFLLFMVKDLPSDMDQIYRPIAGWLLANVW